MPRLNMQIVCPNCATAYEVPDAVFGGRARKLRCENCGTQWRVSPPGGENLAPPGVETTTPPGTGSLAPPPEPAPAAPPATPQPSPIWPEYIAPAVTEEPRIFGKPADENASSEVRQALSKERPEPAPPPAAAAMPLPPLPQPQQAGAIQQNHVHAADPGADSDDPFINLVMAARSRAIEFEPEPVNEPRVKITSPALVGTLAGLFVLSMVVLIFLRH